MTEAAVIEGEELSAGTVVAGKYRIERVLGSGGMGWVVEAKHVQLGQPVALKLLHSSSVADPEVLARFYREGQVTASLDCEHVVKIYDLGQTALGTPYIVMERLRGRDMAEVLSAWGPLPVPLAVECIRQAALGVAEAHAASIVHRDLKPSNLFLVRKKDASPLVKILDFGISKLSGAEQVSLTQTRAVMGSPLYMSPEQLRNPRGVDGRTDVWALGAILQELLTGVPAFDGESLTAVCAQIVSDPPHELDRSDVPPELRQMILRCLEKDPGQRFQTAMEVAEALGSLGLAACLEPMASLDAVPRSRPSSFPSTGCGTGSQQFAVPESSVGVAFSTRGQGSVRFAKDVTTLPQVPQSAGGPSWKFVSGMALALGAALAWTVATRALDRVPPATAQPSASSAPAPEAPAQPVKLPVWTIDSEPSGANVLREGAIIGVTPLELTNLAPGETRRVSVVYDGYDTREITYGHADTSQRIAVVLGRSAAEAKPASGSRPRPSARPAPSRAPSSAMPRAASDIELAR